jgi:hypothetical protein
VVPWRTFGLRSPRRQSSPVEELIQSCKNAGVSVGLGEEPRPRGHQALFDESLSGGNDQVNGWPTFADVVDELQAVHRAGHIHVSKYHADVWPSLKDPDRLVRVRRLKGFKARLDNEIDCREAYQSLIFDDQNRCR